MIVNEIPTFLATEIGIFIGMLILLVFTFVIKRERYVLDVRTHGILVLQAVSGIVCYRVLTFYGLMYNSATDSGLIASASPFVVVVFACLILKEKLTWRGIVGLCFVTGGLLSIHIHTVVFTGGGLRSFRGNVLIFLAVLCEALFSVLSKLSCSKMSALYRTTLIVTYAFICLLPLAIHDILHYDLVQVTGKTILCLLYYGVLVSALSYILWFRGIAHIEARKASLLKVIVPVSSIFLASILLKEAILPIHIFGMVCIIMGIVISNE